MTLSLLLSLAVGTLVSEDLTCVAAATLVARGDLPLLPAVLACAAGIYAGDLALFAVGRAFAARVVDWPSVAARLPAGTAGRFAAWFEARAGAIVIGSRFTPGTRLPLYLAAGACRVPFARFAGWTAIAVGLWTPALVAAGVAGGGRVTATSGAGLVQLPLLVMAAALALLCMRLALTATSLRGRQQIQARVARIWRWEFWPMWIFYAPVAVWTAVLALRHGGYRTITAANPGMADGGVVGESKFEILSKLPPAAVIPAGLVKAGSGAGRSAALDAMLRSRGWTFPVILKPDVGQRGMGVKLVADAAAAAAYLARFNGDVIVQPFHPGPFEAGVFYYRRPGQPRGRILSITDKHFPAVTGDGRSSIEDLIWSHPRRRMQAGTFLSRLGDRSRAVPRTGEHVRLGIAGNHAQGTMFTDGRWMLTPALESRIDAIAASYDGFFIGRFDVRYADRTAFMEGRDLAIVELNGATAESTSIYDPRGTLAGAYRQLFEQWRLVFEIGAANRRRGAAATTARRLWTLIRQHLASPVVIPVSD